MAKRNNFTEEDINNIIKLHNDGLSYQKISENYNVSKTCIENIFLSTSTEFVRITKERENEILDAYIKCGSIKEVKEKLKTSYETVSRILKKNNIIVDFNESHKKYSLNSHYFDVIDTNNKAYIMGLLYSDGCVGKTNNSIIISLQEKDKHILESIRDELSLDYPIKFINYKSKNINHSNQYSLCINDKHMHSVLISHGVVPNKSLILKFPTCISSQFYSKFLLGIMDGDGYISKNPKHKCISFVSTESFCLSAKEIIENKLNIHCSISYCRDKTKSTRILRITGGIQVKKFLDWLYDGAELYLYRKYAIYEKLYL